MHTFRLENKSPIKPLGFLAGCLFMLASLPAFAQSVTIGEGAEMDLQGMGMVDLDCGDLTVNGTLNLGDGGYTNVNNVSIGPNGTINGEMGTIDLSGDWIAAAGATTNPGESTVTWNDDCDTGDILIDGDSNFFNLNLRQPGRTVVFGAGDTTFIEACGFLDMGGDDTNLLTIISDSDGTPAFLEVIRCDDPLDPPFVSYDIDYVDVKDNHATLPGEWIDLGPPEDFNSVDSGGNNRWFLNTSFDLIRFRVTKDFDDGNDNGVTVYIRCNGGTNNQQDFVITEDIPVTFTVTSIDTDDPPNCQIWEDVDSGYDAYYDPYLLDPEPPETCNPFALGGCDNIDSIDADPASEQGCYFDQAFPGDGENFTCHITNELKPVEFEITKEWEPEGELIGLDLSTRIMLDCDGVATIDGDGLQQSYWQWNLNGEGVRTAYVYPDWDGGATCEVSESLAMSAVEMEGCEDEYDIEVGDDDVECTIVNTVFFEGIPTLSDLGLILMALMMLGVGMFGYRRFI